MINSEELPRALFLNILCHSLLCLPIATPLLSLHTHLQWKLPLLLCHSCSHTPSSVDLLPLGHHRSLTYPLLTTVCDSPACLLGLILCCWPCLFLPDPWNIGDSSDSCSETPVEEESIIPPFPEWVSASPGLLHLIAPLRRFTVTLCWFPAHLYSSLPANSSEERRHHIIHCKRSSCTSIKIITSWFPVSCGLLFVPLVSSFPPLVPRCV